MDTGISHYTYNAINNAKLAANTNVSKQFYTNNVSNNGVRQSLEEVAQDFESIFISQMLQPMFEGIKTDGILGGGFGEEIYRSMLIDEYSKDIASGGGIGIADQIIEEMQAFIQGGNDEATNQ